MFTMKFPVDWSLCADPPPRLVFRLVLVYFPVDLSVILSLSVSLDFFSETSEASMIAHWRRRGYRDAKKVTKGGQKDDNDRRIIRATKERNQVKQSVKEKIS